MNEPHVQSIVYEFGDFRLEPARRALTRREGRPVEITAKAFDALVCLIEHAGTVVTRAQLTQTLWPRTIVEDNSLNKLIAALRRALDDHEERNYVVTLQGRGYQFVAAVRTTEAHAPVSEQRADSAADLATATGSTLAEHLLAGPIPLERCSKIALQIAAALEAAHENGVVHGDLKPANVMIMPDERVKVLAFGLAKNLGSLPLEVPSQTALHTEIGTVMGTPSYMSPEQARGESAGRQSDIWSFGVLWYEMLTGRLPFHGDSSAETLGRVLEAQPDYALLPARTPPRVRQLLRRCLEKERGRRFQHTGDLRIEIEDVFASPAAEALPRRRRRPRLAAVGLGAVVLGVVGAWSLAGRFADKGSAEPVYLSMFFPGTPTSMPFGSRHMAISDDGSRIGLVLQGRLWIRRLRDREAIAIDHPGMVNPFFSPNGEWIGFSDNGLLKVPSAGGIPTRIATTTARSAGASWGADGTIVFATTEGLYRVGENGGEAQLLAKPNVERNERLYAWPQFLPNGTAVLFTVFSQDVSVPPQIFVLDLRSLESQPVLTGGAAARLTSTGHLVYAEGTVLKTVEFDLDRRVTHGEAFAPSNIAVASTADNGAAEFALSDTGTLLYLAPRAKSTAGLQTLAWVDRQGKEEPLALAPGYYQFPRISPDGTRVALDVQIPGGNRDIWVLDLGRASLARLTTQPSEDILPLWSADGRRVFFGSDRGGNFDVYSQPADGSSDATAVSAAPGFQLPLSLTPDGTRLVVYEDFHDLSVLDLATSTLEPLLHNEFEHGTSEVSPDGNWIAYEAIESTGQYEVFLRSFPDVAAQREKVSIDGGRHPRWGPPGSGELYYVTFAGEVMAVAVQLVPGLRLGAPTKVFDLQSPPSYRSARPYDISPLDGRFLVTRPVAAAADERTDVSVGLNWFGELLAPH